MVDKRVEETCSFEDIDWLFKRVGEYTWKHLGVSERELRTVCSFREVMDYKEAMMIHYNYEEANYHDTKPKEE